MRVVPASHPPRVAPEDWAVPSRQPPTSSTALRRGTAALIATVSIVGLGLFSLQTVAGNEALDFWLQEWSRGRPQERAAPARADHAAPAGKDPRLRITVRPRRERGGDDSREPSAGGGAERSGDNGAYCV